jgi:hypothetical protein
MGRNPFHRPKKNRWSVEIDGKHINLGPDEAQARVRWHRLMARGLPAQQEWYPKRLQSFLDGLPDAAALTVDQLKRFHVTTWVDAHATWGPSYRRGAITAVQRAFTSAEREGYIARSPVRGIEEPPPRRRWQVRTPDEFQGLLIRVRDAAFRDARYPRPDPRRFSGSLALFAEATDHVRPAIDLNPSSPPCAPSPAPPHKP